MADQSNMADEPPPPPYSEVATGAADGVPAADNVPATDDQKDAKGPAPETQKPEQKGAVFGVQVGEHWIGVNTSPDASGYGIRAFGTIIGVSKPKSEGESEASK
jgi:hypothetical protein